ncbi:MAG TPA: SDR family NAD(P)-dependent oxidoreductase [Vicinamibacterales bacterium]|nr:SDR family NAD(P)-dependent oxidoreductase [Vicinamibacterales bacterium]
MTGGLSLEGRTILLTGCTSGLGREALRVLTLRGARVLGTARTLEGARAACAGVAGLAEPLACELSDPASVRACVAAVRGMGRPLDAVICNAGIMALPRLQLAHGYELQFFTNHIGHFMLVTGLVDRLAERGRVVMLSSVAHRVAPGEGIDFANLDGARGYSPWRSYGRAKLANLLFAKELARRFAGTSRTANAAHPGIISTGLARNNPLAAAFYVLTRPLVQKSIPQGAATEVYVAVHPAAAGLSGQYFADVNVARPSRHAEDPALAARLWKVSEQIVASLPGGPAPVR